MGVFFSFFFVATLFLGGTLAFAEGGKNLPIAVTITPALGNYTTKDNTRFRDKSSVQGIFLDTTSTMSLSPSYSVKKNNQTFSLAIPLVLDYGLEVGLVKAPQAMPTGSALLTMVRFHLDLLRVFSVGGGAYYVEFSNPPFPMRRNGIGAFSSAQFNPLPNGWIHPIIDVRWLGKPMPGTIVFVGLKLGY